MGLALLCPMAPGTFTLLANLRIQHGIVEIEILLSISYPEHFFIVFVSNFPTAVAAIILLWHGNKKLLNVRWLVEENSEIPIGSEWQIIDIYTLNISERLVIQTTITDYIGYLSKGNIPEFEVGGDQDSISRRRLRDYRGSCDVEVILLQ